MRRSGGPEAFIRAAAAGSESSGDRQAGKKIDSNSNGTRVLELAISFNAEALEELKGPFGKDVRSVSVSGIVGEIAGGLRVEDFSARIGKYQTGGTVEVSLSEDRQRIRATLLSEELTFAIPPGEAVTEVESQPPSADRKIPNVELPFGPSFIRELSQGRCVS